LVWSIIVTRQADRSELSDRPRHLTGSRRVDRIGKNRGVKQNIDSDTTNHSMADIEVHSWASSMRKSEIGKCDTACSSPLITSISGAKNSSLAPHACRSNFVRGTAITMRLDHVQTTEGASFNSLLSALCCVFCNSPCQILMASTKLESQSSRALRHFLARWGYHLLRPHLHTLPLARTCSTSHILQT